MTNPWFKFYGGEYLSDTKILQLNAQERSCWITLLCLASQSNGVIRFLSEQQLLVLSGITEPVQMNVLHKFAQLAMIRISNGDVTVLNWEKRQYSEGYSRVKRFRERQSNTEDNDRIEENRIDKNRNTTKISFDKFWDLYPNKVNRKRAEQKWNHLSESTQKLILEDVAKRKESPPWKRDGGAYIPHPTTYLNGERWLDELPANVPNMSSLKLGKAKTHDSHN